ncbi:FAD/NAD(P)-binding domain-containing protein [Lojkania enalia]|uniref:FAD/NAD(P)-binding domain-containing protein n=1 Tax=Lojkania enalia TaxID=147567 RepID=A0A9P4K0R7_9PLEO|nr:FAD/NAD(P)-binding domain-containing protein [Didymosphaeria enalia]
MLSDKVRFFSQILTFAVPYLFTLVRQRISAVIHKHKYKPLPKPQVKNVVVIGGSFAGVQIAKRFTETLPTGYRVVLVEKNSHLNYIFAFPRYSVVKGYEKYAFIPYTGIAKGAPPGIFEHVQDTATTLKKDHVLLSSGEKIEYAFLVLATGTTSTMPSKVSSTSHIDAQAELRNMQSKISSAKRIAVVGGGAVGIEVASDIKDFCPEKDVTLIHSRAQLLPGFGKRLHDYAITRFQELGISVLFNERPKIPGENGTLEFSNGKKEAFDLIIPCTGQKPNSDILASLSPESISRQTSRILVASTLQVSDPSLPNVFAFGDVAETGGPRMARAAHFQGEIVLQNILAIIEGQKPTKFYKPNIIFEGAIKLTLGKSKVVLYHQEPNGREVLVVLNANSPDLGVKGQWRFYGVDVKKLQSIVEEAKGGS